MDLDSTGPGLHRTIIRHCNLDILQGKICHFLFLLHTGALQSYYVFQISCPGNEVYILSGPMETSLNSNGHIFSKLRVISEEPERVKRIVMLSF